MKYLELTLGLILTVTYTWLVIRRRKKSSFIESIFHFDVMIGMIAGLYLLFIPYAVRPTVLPTATFS